MDESLYLLVSIDRKKFKIGIAVDVYQRMLSLKNFWGEFDLSVSCIVTGQATRMSRLEKTLHFIFDKWNIELKEARDGYTEWFNIDCLEDVKDEIKRISQFRSHCPLKLIEGIEIPKQVTKKPNAWQLLSKQEKQELIENRKRKREAQIINENQKNFRRFVELISNIEPYIIEYRKHPEYERHWQLILKSPIDDIRNEVFDLMMSCSFNVFNGGCNVIPSIHRDNKESYFVDISESSIEFLESHEETQEIYRKVIQILEKIKALSHKLCKSS